MDKFTQAPHLVSSTFLVCNADAKILANCTPMIEVPALAPSLEEARANTILFAAATELLAACRAYFGEGDLPKGYNLNKIMSDAIAKATRNDH